MAVIHDTLWIVKKGLKGDLTTVVYEDDTGAKKDLSGLTVKLKFKHPDTAVVTSITGTLMNQSTNRGGVIFNTVDGGSGNSYFITDDIDYKANLELSQGSTLLDPSNDFVIRVSDTN